jgi:hypothetical protein
MSEYLKTNWFKALHDDTHFYTKISNKLLKLKPVELAIMVHILSNDDAYNVTRKEMFKRVGLTEGSGKKPWSSLVKKGYIVPDKSKGRGKGKTQYTIYEDPLADYITEDPTYSTATGGTSVNDYSTATYSTTTGGLLTTTNNNYYRENNTVTGDTNINYSKEFDELVSYYPVSVIRPKGNTDRAIAMQVKAARKHYNEYLRKAVKDDKLMQHDDIIKALKAEITERESIGEMKYFKDLSKYVYEGLWKAFDQRNIDNKPVEPAYGTELI